MVKVIHTWVKGSTAINTNSTFVLYGGGFHFSLSSLCLFINTALTPSVCLYFSSYVKFI